jgi:2-polyprenyl-6-methoxyphenol hydroxylase-like FAD-dependent oxidoreductase
MARAVVVGAGVGGLAAGVALQRRGWDVSVLERAGALEAVGAGLALAPNALKALDVLGVGDRVRSQSTLQGEAGIVRPDGRWISRTTADVAVARYGDPTVVLHRAALVELLAGALAPGTLRLGADVTAVQAATGTVHTAAHGALTADVVVAADGINSPVRRALFPHHPAPVYAGVTSWRMVVPAPAQPVVPVETWGRGRVFGVTVLGDGRVYCYATAPAPAGARAADEKAELVRLFGAWHAPVPQLIASADQVLRTDIRYLGTALPTFHCGRVVLLGDAAHAMTPNLGQGGCQALEDAVVLAAYAALPDGLARYSAERVPRTAAVAAASRRIGRLTMVSNPAAVLLRDAALQLAGRLGPNLVLKQMDPVLGWRPPAD